VKAGVKVGVDCVTADFEVPDDCATLGVMIMGLRKYNKLACPQDKQNCDAMELIRPAGDWYYDRKKNTQMPIKSKSNPNVGFEVTALADNQVLLDGLQLVVPAQGCDDAARLSAWCECRNLEQDSRVELAELMIARTPERAEACKYASYADPGLGQAYKYRVSNGYHYAGVVLKFGPFTVTCEVYSTLQRGNTVKTYYFNIYPVAPLEENADKHPTFYDKYKGALADVALAVKPAGTANCNAAPFNLAKTNGDCNAVNIPLKCALSTACGPATGFTKAKFEAATDVALIACNNCITKYFKDRDTLYTDGLLDAGKCATATSKAGYTGPNKIVATTACALT